MSKELLKNFLTHLFYSIDPHINHPSVFREWESVWQSKLIKAHAASFLHNSLWLHNPLPRSSEGMGAVRGSWVHCPPCQGRVQDSQHRPSLCSSSDCHRQPVTKCDPFPSTSGTLGAAAIPPSCHCARWCAESSAVEPNHPISSEHEVCFIQFIHLKKKKIKPKCVSVFRALTFKEWGVLREELPSDRF